MDKKILFITESDFTGKVDRNNINCRTDLAWMIALDAVHIPLYLDDIIGEYDLGIIIIPKRWFVSDIKNAATLNVYINNYIKKCCKKITIMQEADHEYFQDGSVWHQFEYYNILLQADFLLCHNDIDVYYFAGLTGKPSYVFQSLMIEDTVKDINRDIKRDGVMIGGNFVKWYSGFSSYVVSNEFDCKKYIPKMGRASDDEHSIEDLNILPYTNWTNWIKNLNKVKYGVHLMRTHAAGTFALNCSYLKIPCIGYYGLDTQQILHPSTTIEIGDITAARKIANQLVEDKHFYEKCATETKLMYDMFYKENIFKMQFNKILVSEGIIDEEEI